MASAVFWDRDGTLIADPGYLSDPDQVALLPGAAEAIRKLSAAGLQNIVVSNQSGIARGLFDESALEKIHERLRELLGESGAQLDAIYYCPYLPGPEAVVEKYRLDSDLRKPRPGMLIQAAREQALSLAECWMIGNSLSDVQAGRAAGCRTIFLRPSTGDVARDNAIDFFADSLLDAADIVLRHAQPTSAHAHTENQAMSDSETHHILQEILNFLRLADRRSQTREFSLTHLAAAIVQIIAVCLALWAIIGWLFEVDANVIGVHLLRLTAAVYFQLLSLTLFVMVKR